MFERTLGLLAPRTRGDIFRKFLLFCGLITVWNVSWVWYVRGQLDRSLVDLILDALVVGGPFAAIFTIGSWHQVTAIKSLNLRARYDALSGLLNRQSFIDRLERELSSARTGMLLLIDADHFKNVNDLHGHPTGDRCITAIGRRLVWHLREEDIAGRLGGEEFAVFLPDVPPEHGRVVAERLGQPVAFSDQSGEVHLSISLSMGAVWTSFGADADVQLVLADEALYRAKSEGRARLCISGEEEPILLGTASPVLQGNRRASRVMSRQGSVAAE